MRVEALSLMACSDSQLSPVFDFDRVIGNAHFGPMEPPVAEARQRYIRMEAVSVAHHASETLLRLFFAHVEHEECPWLGMSASVAFPEFKKGVDSALKSGFEREQIAKVFLGGTSPTDACIQLADNEFEEAIDALELLLVDCGNRCLSDSFLYNAVKHGVTAVGIHDDDVQIALCTDGGSKTTLHEGPMHFYIHKKEFPAAPDDGPKWFHSCEDSNPGSELSVSLLISDALDSLWAVARRRYTGASGSITYANKAQVEMSVYGMTMIAGNRLRRLTSEMIKRKADGTVDGTTHRHVSYDIPGEFSLETAATGSAKRVIALPARQRDRQLYSTSKAAYLPFTPPGFERG
jgi:hypothetical protein